MCRKRAMSEFQPVLKVDELPDPGRTVVEVDEQFIVLIHAGGQFYALDDVCTHDGGPLGEGVLEDHAIACPRHGAKFDIRTGQALSMPATRPTRVHEVQVREGRVLVRLSEDS